MSKKYIKIPDLNIKIKLIETLFNHDKLYADDSKKDTHKIGKKTVEKWLAEKARPTEKSLNKLCKMAGGITIDEFSSPLDEFAQILAKKEGHGYAENQITGEIKRLQAEFSKENPKKKGEGLMAILSEAINSVSPSDLKKVFARLEGYYYAYIKWFNWKESDDNDPKISLYKFLLKIDELDEAANVIKAKVSTYEQLNKYKDKLAEKKWAYEGVVIPIGGNFYFIFEHIIEPSAHMDYVFIITRDRPESHLSGLLMAESAKDIRIRYFDPPGVSFPASSRIVMMKIDAEEVAKGEDYLMRDLRHYDADELNEFDQKLIEGLNRGATEGILRL